MSDLKEHLEAFQRILKIADRNHLYSPFKSAGKLRAKHFPGAGPQLTRSKLREAYTREFTDKNPDQHLLEHSTWPWIDGYSESLAYIVDDLIRAAQQTAPPELPAKRQQELVRKFTQGGAEEIAAFWTIFVRGNPDYQKAVIETLEETEPVQPPRIQTTGTPRKKASETEPTEPTPQAHAGYALMGGLMFTIPSLILVAVQYWRQPQKSHWIVLSIAAFLGLITLGLLADYLRKKSA